METPRSRNASQALADNVKAELIPVRGLLVLAAAFSLSGGNILGRAVPRPGPRLALCLTSLRVIRLIFSDTGNSAVHSAELVFGLLTAEVLQNNVRRIMLALGVMSCACAGSAKAGWWGYVVRDCHDRTVIICFPIPKARHGADHMEGMRRIRPAAFRFCRNWFWIALTKGWAESNSPWRLFFKVSSLTLFLVLGRLGRVSSNNQPTALDHATRATQGIKKGDHSCLLLICEILSGKLWLEKLTIWFKSTGRAILKVGRRALPSSQNRPLPRLINRCTCPLGSAYLDP